MTDMKIPTSPTAEADRSPSRGRLVAAVVAIAVVAAGFMLLDRPGEQEQTEVAAPADTPVQLAYRIIEARNAFDADALVDLLGAAQYGDVVDVTGYVQWLEAFDWRLLDPVCEQASDVAIACSYIATNRLIRHAGLEGEEEKLYLIFESGVESGALTSVSETAAGTSDYSSRAFEPFFRWVIANHSEAAEVMWPNTQDESEFTDEMIRLFDEMLTEYTGTG